MTRGRAVVLTTLAVALVAAATATAAGTSQRLSGHIRGDSESVVRITVANDNDGNPKVLKQFRFKKVNATCDGVAQRITVRLYGRVPFEKDGTFERRFGDSANGFVKVEGGLNRRDGVAGIVRSPGLAIAGLGLCKVAPSGFKVG